MLLEQKAAGSAHRFRWVHDLDVGPYSKFITKPRLQQQSGTHVVPGSKARNYISHIRQTAAGAGGKGVDKDGNHRFGAMVSYEHATRVCNREGARIGAGTGAGSISLSQKAEVQKKTHK